jgi:hypothetical protein
MATNVNRQPKGTPVGGRFAEGRKPEGGDLFETTKPQDRELQDRQAALIAGLGMKATVIAAGDRPRFAGDQKKVDRWWERKFIAGEYSPGVSPEDRDFKKMPDDYTPSMTPGNATTHNRRTHRMHYAGPEVDMRMPSYASVNRFASENPGESFDVPVTAEYPGGSIEGWVRVARTENGTWRAKGLGFSPEQTAYVDEAVLCVLEARRPSRALSGVASLVESRRERFARQGVQVPQLVTSGWIKNLGYDSATDTMMMETETGKSYGYKVPLRTYQAVALAHSPGSVFNRIVKKNAERVEVTKCPNCKRTSAVPGHKCPPTMSAPRNDDEVRGDNTRIRRWVSKHRV